MNDKVETTPLLDLDNVESFSDTIEMAIYALRTKEREVIPVKTIIRYLERHHYYAVYTTVFNYLYGKGTN